MSAPGEFRPWNQADFDALPYDSNYCPSCKEPAYKAEMVSAGPVQLIMGVNDPWIKFEMIIQCKACNTMFGSYDGC